MSYLDLLLLAAVLAGGMAARQEALAHPPAELLQNIELLDDLPLIEGGEEAP
ncbi:MAG: hypothetical protein HYV14_00220 [Elusimicrobia bacterium]|nr:hypothetical protein [Elusimicrobiota bacterium]